MTDEAALLAAIRARPDDDTPRLVYADWCDDNDRPERAEFIRVQCRLAVSDPSKCPTCGNDYQRMTRGGEVVGWCSCGGGPPWADVEAARAVRRRERDLFDALPDTDKKGFSMFPEWSRGFPFRTHMGVEGWVADAARLLSTAPLRWVRLHGENFAACGPLFHRGGDEYESDRWPGVVLNIEYGDMAGVVIGGVRLTAEEWIDRGDELLEVHDITRVELATVPLLDLEYDPDEGYYCRLPDGEWRQFERGELDTWEKNRDMAARLLRDEWPGIEFRLPTLTEQYPNPAPPSPPG